MTTSSVATVFTTLVGTSWDYISAAITPLLPFAVGIGVLAGGIYFILRRLHILR